MKMLVGMEKKIGMIVKICMSVQEYKNKLNDDLDQS